MSKYFTTATTTNATNAAANTNIYHQSNVGPTTNTTTGAIRKLFGENVVATGTGNGAAASVSRNVPAGNAKTTRIFMTQTTTAAGTASGQQQQRHQQLTTATTASASANTMATHLLDHGYGVTMTPPTVSNTMVVGQQQSNMLSSTSTTTTTTTTTNNSNATSPASQQQKYKPTDMTQYYKVSNNFFFLV